MVTPSLPALYAEPREVPVHVLDALRGVSAGGWEDMYDRECVMMLAASLGYEDAADWLVDHRHLYFIALRQSGWTSAVPVVSTN